MIVAFWKVKGTFMLRENQKSLTTRSNTWDLYEFPYFLNLSLVAVDLSLTQGSPARDYLPHRKKDIPIEKCRPKFRWWKKDYLMIGIYFYEYWWNTRLFLLKIRGNEMRSECRITFFYKMHVVGLTSSVAYEKSLSKVQLSVMSNTYFR